FLTSGWLGELPDGSISPRHRFRHVLYREVPYSLIAPMRRAQIHQRIAERAVEIFRQHANEIAAERAMNFEQSRDWPRALEYLVTRYSSARGQSRLCSKCMARSAAISLACCRKISTARSAIRWWICARRMGAI